MEHQIINVTGIAKEVGIEKGDFLVKINGEEIIDFIDYNYLTSNEEYTLTIKRDNELYDIFIEQYEDEVLGLEFETQFMDKQKSCKNKCVFCFIDQMPKKLRDTLYFKDDDWRLSLMMGNYVTLTNTTDQELDRIIKRHVSPLYISVHATDKDVRKKLIKNPNCDILPKIKKLSKNGITLHCQVVLCPGINDAQVLRKTLSDLNEINCVSCAVVPVGITKFRQGLEKLTTVNEDCANTTLDIINEFNQLAGKKFCFASDEFYIKANRPFLSYEEYGEFELIEDGIGMCAFFEHEFNLAKQGLIQNNKTIWVLCGELVKNHLQKLFDTLPNKNVFAKSITNNFFGDTITVSGLVVGSDIIEQLKDEKKPDTILIPSDMLKHNENVFLDNITIEQLEKELTECEIKIIYNGASGIIDCIRKEEI